jgi:hypothetical protein
MCETWTTFLNVPNFKVCMKWCWKYLYLYLYVLSKFYPYVCKYDRALGGECVILEDELYGDRFFQTPKNFKSDVSKKKTKV